MNKITHLLQLFVCFYGISLSLWVFFCFFQDILYWDTNKNKICATKSSTLTILLMHFFKNIFSCLTTPGKPSWQFSILNLFSFDPSWNTHLYKQLKLCDPLERKNEERGKGQALDTWMLFQCSHGLSKCLIFFSGKRVMIKQHNDYIYCHYSNVYHILKQMQATKIKPYGWMK